MAEDVRPVYLRLRDIITASILDGVYDDGAMLPSVRALAAAQGANPLTVAKAYQSFQDDGLILVRRGVGLFLAEGASARVRAAERARFLGSVWPPVAQQMRRLGLTHADLPQDVSQDLSLGEDA
ncbi:GntR family transcriptional regulator [Sphingobium sufflavum]|uniref:GntR family transcriptional regulator n=1 Tax=Sphingobium sufflavum TaxID=1129547 RepID=UPI001F29FB87|nr:GntR family transcriptional regulator [Sphingobium sufflavum]MCE7794990.1 GntR family transcriptional regulator [Sphingobium sufflavum]